MVWPLLASEYGFSPAARRDVEAYDSLGKRVL
jgi:hypothetical protein